MLLSKWPSELLAERLMNSLHIPGIETTIKLDSSPPSDMPKRAISQSHKVIDGVILNPIPAPKITPIIPRKSGRGGKREGAGRKRKTLNNNNNVSPPLDKTPTPDISISPSKHADHDLITSHISTPNSSDGHLDRSIMDTKTN